MAELDIIDMARIVLCPPGAFINGLVTAVIISKRELRTYANAMLAADTSLGVLYNLVVMPLHSAVYSYYFEPICSLVTTSFMSIFVALFWLECGIAVERAIFVYKPLHYYLLVTRKRVAIFIAVVLLYFIMLTSAVYYIPDPDLQEVLGPTYQFLILFGNFTAEDVAFAKCETKPLLMKGYFLFMLYANCVLAAGITVSLFSAILITARRLARSSPNNNVAGQPPPVSSNNSHTVAVLLTCNIIRALLWVPPVIYTTVELDLFGGTFNSDYIFEERVYLVMTGFSQLSTIVCPLIFATMQRDFRKCLKTLLCQCCKKSPNTVTG